MPKPNPFIKGERFGRLIALGEYKSFNGGKYTYEKMLCDCGNVKRIGRRPIRKGQIKSCGCLNRENGRLKLIKANTTHGMANTRIYKIYTGIRDRCNNINNPCYDRYGERGIKCKREKFEDFYKDMGESYKSHVEEYGTRDTTIERINNDEDYCKENCRWATLNEQCNNKNRTRYVTYKGETLPLGIMCKKYGVKYKLVRSRLVIGWSINDAMEKPKQKYSLVNKRKEKSDLYSNNNKEGV